MIKVALIDNQTLHREGLELLLRPETQFRITEQCPFNVISLNTLKTLNVDLLIIDPYFKTQDGADLLTDLFKSSPAFKTLILTLNIDAVMSRKWLEIGVSGLISKDCSLSELMKAMKTVANGEYYLCQDIAHTVALQGLLKTEAFPFLKLSRRESQVADMLLQGKNIQEISRILDISDKTANTYKYRLYEKLAVKNDVQLTRLAYKFNYLSQ